MLVIGTTATVYPAAGYVDQARQLGARVVVVNMDGAEGSASDLRPGDFLFQGDAAKILPEILKPVIGEMDVEGRWRLKTEETAGEKSGEGAKEEEKGTSEGKQVFSAADRSRS
jgi:hypothetical protein